MLDKVSNNNRQKKGKEYLLSCLKNQAKEWFTTEKPREKDLLDLYCSISNETSQGGFKVRKSSKGFLVIGRKTTQPLEIGSLEEKDIVITTLLNEVVLPSLQSKRNEKQK